MQKHEKLNWLQRNLPDGLLVDAAWLERQGYSSALRSKYVKHGWLNQVVRGVYRRPPSDLPAAVGTASLQWQHVVISLQTLLKHRVAVGGRTALEIQGFAHYLASTGPREVHLYGVGGLPNWILKLPLEARFLFHNAARLFPVAFRLPQGRHGDSVLHDPSLTSQPWGNWDWPLVISTPERAVLELLDEVPRRETFHQADVLMEGLSNLRPNLLHDLLVACRSVKVKRLFLWFAERHNHAWLKRLDRNGIDLGRGKRMLAVAGKLDSRFNITVPEDLYAAE